MAKTYHSSNRWALTGLFKRINLGDDPNLLQSEARHLAEKVDANDIADAQQTLIDEGYPSQIVEKISAAFILMGLHEEKKHGSKSALTDNHILKKIAAENNLAKCYLQDLTEITVEIDRLDELTDVSAESRRLVRIVEYFCHFKRHIEREKDIIFPYIKKFGWEGICKTSEANHELILRDIDNLVTLTSSLDVVKTENFKKYLTKFVHHLVPMMQNHLAYQEEIFWPIALIVIDDVKTWDLIKMLSDEFEY